jgi:hypothetical protein
MAFIRANARLAAALLLSFPVSAVNELAGARPRTTHFQAVTQKAENANPS